MFEFVELPDNAYRPARDNTLIMEFSNALRARPGDWARYPLSASSASSFRSLAYRINQGGTASPKYLRDDDDGCFQAATRDGMLYVRFVKAV